MRRNHREGKKMEVITDERRRYLNAIAEGTVQNTIENIVPSRNGETVEQNDNQDSEESVPIPGP
jgi:hypothetical protein